MPLRRYMPDKKHEQCADGYMGDPSAHAKSQQHHNDATQDELIATEHDRIILLEYFFITQSLLLYYKVSFSASLRGIFPTIMG